MKDYVTNSYNDEPYVRYGIRQMSLAEEMALPENVDMTRRNKMVGIDTCKNARELLETLEIRLRNAPEIDDKDHSILVKELVDQIREIYTAVADACMFGKC